MTFRAFDAPMTNARPAAAAAGPFASFKWQAFLAIFMQRIGVNQTIGGVLYPLPVSLVAMPLVLGWLIARGWAKPSPTRIWLYCAMVVGGCMSMLLARGEGSALSMYMYFALYIFFLFPVVLDDDAYQRFFRMVVKLGAAICALGVAQYLIQYLWSPPFLFTWRELIAPEFLIEYNSLNPTTWGSGIYKANGVFLMEPSWLSQLGARTMLLAVIMLRDPRYLIPCGLALLATYSGTGIVLFAIFGTVPLIMLMAKSRYLLWAIAALVGIPLLLGLFASDLNLELFTNRLAEFSNPRASGFMRFVLAQQVFEGFLNEPILKLLFGSGPGAVDSYYAGYVTDGFAPGWLKLTVDYGFFGFVAFCAFLLTCVWQTTRSAVIAAAILFQYLVLDGSLVVPQAAFVTLLMAAAVVRRSTFRPFGATVETGKFAPA